ncbi:Transcriptional adapter ada2 [Basidiobolus ranarum]|uniref:Transcriptional adapter ada2 n=1 Tax=Basidiobolus ranarum TaxID=34480 RepID=A0ABR2WN94_9FUNG
MIGRKPANPLDIQEADGVHLLTPAEQTICSALRILPKAYMVIKETILKEYARLGSLKRRQARELIKIDVNKTSKIYDFFIEMGWIKPPARGAASTSTNGTPA